MTNARHAGAALAGLVILVAALPMLSGVTAATSAHVDQALLEPEGAFSYPEDSLAYAEIHRTLADTEIIQHLDAALRSADAETRRNAEIGILLLVKTDPLRLFRQLRSE